MVTGSAAIGELGWRLRVGQHSLFFLSAATVLSAAPWWRQRGASVTLRPNRCRTDRQSFQLTGQYPHSKDATTGGGISGALRVCLELIVSRQASLRRRPA